MSMARKIIAKPATSFMVRGSPRKTMPLMQPIKDSRDMIKEAFEGLTYFSPTACSPSAIIVQKTARYKMGKREAGDNTGTGSVKTATKKLRMPTIKN